jgi:hypothetical protein
MVLLDTNSKEILRHVVRRPVQYFTTAVYPFLFFICLLTLDVRHAVVDTRAVLASGVVSTFPAQTVVPMRSMQIGNVLVDDI